MTRMRMRVMIFAVSMEQVLDLEQFSHSLLPHLILIFQLLYNHIRDHHHKQHFDVSGYNIVIGER